MRRGCTDPRIVKGVNTRRPKDFKLFLMNDQNKQSLCNMLLKVWSNNKMAQHLNQKEVILVVDDGKATLLTSDQHEVNSTELPALFSTHDETDRRVVIYTIMQKNRVMKLLLKHRILIYFLFFYIMHSGGQNLKS